MSTSSVIEIEDVSKNYGPVQALSHLNLAVGAGEMFGFLGPNGTGKTTTIRLLTGFLKPSEGRIRVFNMDPWREAVEVKRRIGFIPDLTALYEGMTGHELLMYLGRLQKRDAGGGWKPICDRLELSQDALRRKIKGYSHGMKQKLAIVQALQHKPELLVLDEPTQGLDPLSQKSFFALLQDAQAGGTTVLFSSHILWEVEQSCERVGIIRQGTLVAVEQVRELQRRRVRSMELSFRSDPPDDLDLPGVEVLERDGTRWRLAIRGDVNPVVRALARYDLDDLVFERPHLEDIFMDYYRAEAADS